MSVPDGIAELLAAAVGGDVAALTALLTASYADLLNRIRRRVPADLRGQLDAEDVVQEVHMAVFRYIGEFQPQGGTSFERWIQTIGMHKLRKAIRARRRLKRGGGQADAIGPNPPDDSVNTLLYYLQAPGRTPSGSVARLEAIEALRAALDLLPEDYRQAVWLVYIQGVPVASAAAEMNRSEHAVHNLCFKAKEHLRGLLTSQGHGPSSR